ncbi:MAG: hypothetical protein ACI9F9_001292 [Candidatus Paceibacteria bacterium]|jgi:hypothetical protein
MIDVVLDEEEKGLMRKILRAQAYRQMMAANILGHGLKYLVDPEGRLGIVQDMQHILTQVSRVQALYTTIDGGDIRHEAAARMDRIPYPATRFELATFLATSDAAEELAMKSYVDSKCKIFAAIARDDLQYERQATKRSQALFEEFAADVSQAPLVQQVLRRWLVICLLSLGRPGTAGDRRVQELGLRRLSVAESVTEYLERLQPLIEMAGLTPDDLRDAGIELPV